MQLLRISDRVADIKDRILAWPNVSAHPHRMGGVEFRLESAEIGHLHNDGTLHILFPRSLRDELLAEGLAKEHRWAPNTGISFHVSTEDEVRHAIWLLRLSYLRFALKKATDSQQLLEHECEQLQLNPRLRILFEPFVRTRAGPN